MQLTLSACVESCLTHSVCGFNNVMECTLQCSDIAALTE